MSKLSNIPENTDPGKYPVTYPITKAEFRKLSGFRGYPQDPTSEQHFIETFRSVCISVGHARAVVLEFQGIFPTIKEIRDAAFTLRPKFEPPKKSEREEWEEKYGPPDANFASDLVSGYEAGRVSWNDKDIAMWRHLKKHMKVSDWAHVSWKSIYIAMRELGYPLNEAQIAIMER